VRSYLHTLSLTVAPKAAAWSRHLGKLVAAGKDQEAVDSLFDGGGGVWSMVKEAGVDPVAGWLVRDPARRADALERAFSERVSKEGMAQAASQAADWTRHLKEDIADWTGELSEAQVARVESFTAQAAYPLRALNEERRRREQALVSAIRAGAPREEVARQLRRWWLTPEKDRDKACSAALQEYRRGLRDMLVSVVSSLSPGQRAHLASRLAALAEDLDGIYRKAVLSPSP
jgi:hypothetical protein